MTTSSYDGLCDLSELKNLVNEMNQDLEFQNLTMDGSQNHMRFRSTKYPATFFENLNEFRENHKFCDVLLRLTSVNNIENG